MKKLFISALLFMIMGIAIAQTATFNMSSRATTRTVNTNYTLTNTTVMWFQWNASKAVPTTQDFQVNLDSLAGNHTNIAIKLYGRKFSSDSWTQISSTVNSTTGTATETISNTVMNRFRQYKSEFTGTGTGTTIIDFQILKLWKE